MSMKKSTLRKMAEKPAVRGNRPVMKRSRAAAATLPDTLPIVEGDSGRSLRLRARLGMNREMFARLVPMSTRNLANIESGKAPSPNVQRQLQELRRVVDALAEVIQADAVGPWLGEPNGAFEGLKPIEVIERGEVDRIWQMIYHLRSGAPS